MLPRTERPAQVFADCSHLQVVLLAGVQGVAAEVRLELYVIFKRLIGGREGHRGEKLNHQTKKGEEQRNKGGKEATECERGKENGLKRGESRGNRCLFLVKGCSDAQRGFFYNYRLRKQESRANTSAPLLTEYTALTMREAVDTLPESSSRLWVSLFIVSTLMSGLPSVTPRRPGRENE